MSRSICGCGCWRSGASANPLPFRERTPTSVASEPGEGRDHAPPGPAPGSLPRRPLPEDDGEEKPKNICCVGDDDQSIYGWRGAEVDNILRFEHDFPGATVIRLERNYRSTGHILAAASHLIAHNEGRLGKTLRTDDVLGEKVTVTGSWDSAKKKPAPSARRSSSCSARGHALNQIAILVRASFQMREFEDRFVTLGLPYRVIGGPRFYERAEIRDALAYLRVVNSPADDLAFERIVNVPKRGLGDATVQLLHDHARKRRVPLTEAARAMIETDELKPKPRGALRARARKPSTAGASSATRCRTTSSPRSSSTRAATPRCGRRTAPPTPPAAWKTSKSWSAPWRSSRTCRAFSNTSRW